MRNSIQFCLPGLMTCLFVGCGGGEEAPQESVPAQTASPVPADPAPAAVKVAKNDDDRQGSEKEGKGKGKGKGTKVKPAPQPAVAGTAPDGNQSSVGNVLAAAMEALTGAQSPTTLPENVAQWSPAHFELAVRRRNSKLPGAIRTRAAEAPPAEFVSLMTRLLEVSAEPAVVPAGATRQPVPGNARPAPAESDDGRRFMLKFHDEDDDRRSRGKRKRDKGPATVTTTPAVPAAVPLPGDGELTVDALTRGIFTGLLVNDSEEAWDALKAILDGSQSTPLDSKQNAIALFEGMFGTPNVSTVMIESVAVSVVDSPGPGQTGQMILASLGARALQNELYLPVGDNDSKQNGTGLTPTTGRSGLMGQGLIGLSKRNRRKRDEDDDRNRPVATVPDQSNELPAIRIPPASMDNLISVIHGQELQQAVNEKLRAMSTVMGDLSLLRFASTIPEVRLRQTIFELYQSQYGTGASSIINAGLFGTDPVDPGHLVILKSLPRSAPTSQPRRSSRRRDRDSNTAAVARIGAPEDSWTEATWLLANGLRQQLRQVANNPQLELQGNGPIRLHRGAETDVAIQITIEDGSKGTEDSAVNTQVFYSRCYVSGLSRPEMGKIAKHYESRTKGYRRERPDDGVLWFDGVRKGRDGTRTSMDVMIERSTAPAVTGFGGFAGGRNDRRDARQGGAGAGGGYTVEAIAVVTTDPKVAISTANNESNQPDSR